MQAEKYGSILDQLEESHLDVQKLAQNDISGSKYHFEPFQFRYLFAIPIETIELINNDYSDYVSDLDYIFSCFADGHQIMLRKINFTRESTSESFPTVLLEEMDMFPVDHKIDSYQYTYAVFVQFNIDKIWSHHTAFRFLMALSRFLVKHETLNYKSVYIYKQYYDMRDYICITKPENDYKYIYVKYNKEGYPKFKITDDCRVVLENTDENYKTLNSMISVSKEWDQTIFYHQIQYLKLFDNPSKDLQLNISILKDFAKEMNVKYYKSAPYNTIEFYQKYIKSKYKK